MLLISFLVHFQVKFAACLFKLNLSHTFVVSVKIFHHHAPYKALAYMIQKKIVNWQLHINGVSCKQVSTSPQGSLKGYSLRATPRGYPKPL